MPSPSGGGVAMGIPHGGLLLVTASLQPGGAERVLVNLANGCAPHVPTALVSLSAPDGPLRLALDDAVEVIELPHRRVRSAAPALVRLIRARRPSVVLSSHAHVSILLGLLRPLLPTEVRTIAREPDIRSGNSAGHRGVRLAHRTVYRAHHLVLATSRRMAADLARRRRGPIAVLPNPVDEIALRASAARPPTGVDAPPGPAGPGRSFVHAGRLAPEKRIGELIDAFAAGTPPEDRLVLVGDGPERERIRSRTVELGIEHRVVLTGYDPAPERHVARADLLVLASASEGMPNVVLESLAVGTPVLATEDLVTLQDLAATTEGAVRLVPRAALASAMAEHGIPPRPERHPEPLPRPSLLPPEHRREAVVVRFLVLAGLHDDAPA